MVTEPLEMVDISYNPFLGQWSIKHDEDEEREETQGERVTQGKRKDS